MSALPTINPATLKDAPAVLNTNDKAMWVLGYNAAIAALPAINPASLTAREVELLREIRVNFGNLDQLSADWRNEARTLLLRIEQAAGVSSDEPALDTKCAECGHTWGDHHGDLCPVVPRRFRASE